MIFIIYSSNYSKSTDHYEKYLDSIENEIINNTDSILEGNLIDLNEYSNKIKGEVVDINGKHLFGDIDIIDSKVDILKYLKFNSVKDGYVYRGVPLIKDDSIKKNKLKQSIDDDVTELISRFKKEEKKGNKK